MRQLLALLFSFLNFCAIVQSAVFKAVSKENEVSNHSHPISTFPAEGVGFCAVKCEALGKSDCKAFIVRKDRRGFSCELFRDRSHDVITDRSMIFSRHGRHFERTCDELSLKTGVRDVIDGQVIVTLIDLYQNVYQQRANTELSLLGRVSEVFEGFDKVVSDMTSTSLAPLGYVHLLLSGDVMYCYVAGPGLRKFTTCAGPFFPLKLSSVLGQWIDSIYSITYDLYRRFQYYLLYADVPYIGIITGSEESLKSDDMNKKLSKKEEVAFHCSNPLGHDTYDFCQWPDVWQAASGGMFLSLDRICFFLEASCYVFDFNCKTMTGRFPTCKDEINDFLL